MPSPPPLPTSERHYAVLRQALLLLAERGYAGASLRELARRVGMKQPSLYHYFRSKEELVEQLIEHMPIILDMRATMPEQPPLETIPPMLARAALHLYRGTDWALFVRFVFALSLSEPRFRPALKALFVDRLSSLLDETMQPYVDRGEITREHAHHVVRMTLNAVSLLMIEQTILYPGEPGVTDADAFADFVGRFVADGLARLPATPSGSRRPSRRRADR